MRRADATHSASGLPPSIRFRVDPRLVPADKAARRLHLTAKDFAELLPALVQDGFPQACPITGNFDLMAIDAWQDRRSGLAGADGSPASAASADIVKARLATIG